MDEGPARADVWLARESEKPDMAVVGLPWSPTSQGVALTPLAVRDRLKRFTTYHTEAHVDLSDVQVRDSGNWPVAGLSLGALEEYISTRRDELPSRGLSLFLGGDDAITSAIVGALETDLVRISCTAMEVDQTVTLTIGAHGFTRLDGSEALTNDEIDAEGIPKIVDRALDKLAMSKTIHVSVDLDTLDPAFAPASPGSMPGGLDVRRLADAVRRLARSPKVGSMDFVGADVHFDESGRTLDVICHLLLSAMTGFKERSSAA